MPSFNKLIGQIENWVWYLFLFTAAWQTRFIVWQADKQFVEWRSMAFYFSDALVLLLFVLAASRGWLSKKIFRKSDWLLFAFIGVALMSLRTAAFPALGFFQTLRLLEFILLFIYMRSWAFGRFGVDKSMTVFVAGALVQSVLGVAQYILQHDVGIRAMGETLLATDMHGVAVFYDLAHSKILRAYGTLPHPNVLSAYLALALWGLGWLYIRHGNHHKYIWAASGALMLTAFYLTYSRTMIAFWLLGTFLIFGTVWWSRVSGKWPAIAQIRVRSRDMIILILAVSALFAVWQGSRILARMSISASDESVALRVIYARDALKSGNGHLNINWTGVGIGNFTTWLAGYDKTLPSFLYQPTHNLFLLIYSELGIFGILLWLVWLSFVTRSSWLGHRGQPFIRSSLVIIIGAMLMMAMFDHFFWTLQQGRILWWGVLAIAAL